MLVGTRGTHGTGERRSRGVSRKNGATEREEQIYRVGNLAAAVRWIAEWPPVVTTPCPVFPGGDRIRRKKAFSAAICWPSPPPLLLAFVAVTLWFVPAAVKIEENKKEKPGLNGTRENVQPRFDTEPHQQD